MTNPSIASGPMTVFALGLWIGNKDTAEIVFTEQLATIKSKGYYWNPQKLSLIGRVRVVNIFILSRLWHRTEIFSIPHKSCENYTHTL